MTRKLNTGKYLTVALIGTLFLTLVTPAYASHEVKDQVAAWLPWFQFEEGIESARDHLDELDTLYLFVYEIDANGEIIEKIDLENDEYEDLLDEARDEGVALIPTMAWFDGDAIHEVLGDDDKREELIEDIEDLVDDNDFDGVDIDFEQKKAETYDHFADFLEELEDELGRDDLVCSIEARTPPESLYRDVPEDIEYANDYDAINRYCDIVQIMAYDQQRADILLNDERRGVPYSPVADRDWVEKVIELALEDIDEDKIMLGVPTYGRAWDITVAPMWYRDYTRVASLNQPRILELSEKYDSPIGRTEAGEGVITYFPEDSVFTILNQLPTPSGTPKGFEAAAKALLFSTATEMEVPVRFVTWSDADSIEDKLELADDYDLRGISIFKVDGEEDPAIWDLF